MKRFVSTILFGTIFCLGSAANAAKPPVLIEFFGVNGCASDVSSQENLQEVLEKNENVIVLNCRVLLTGPGTDRTFGHDFCNKRLDAYSKKFRTATVFQSIWAVVNGRWDGNIKNITPAVNLGRTDNVKDISMSVYEDAMDISIPELESQSGFGEMYLYVYAPSQGDEEAFFVDPDLELTDDVKEDISNNVSVPFVTKRRTDNLFVRPVIAMEKIGKWVGEKMDVTISLREIKALAGSLEDDLSYVVVLHDGSDFGPVLAAGEMVASVEADSALPSSEPYEIKLMSQPPQPVVPE